MVPPGGLGRVRGARWTVFLGAKGVGVHASPESGRLWRKERVDSSRWIFELLQIMAYLFLSIAVFCLDKWMSLSIQSKKKMRPVLTIHSSKHRTDAKLMRFHCRWIVTERGRRTRRWYGYFVS